MHSEIAKAPEAGRVRLVGEVRYDGAGLGSELYWFEAPESLAGALTSSGNPWLACLLPLAVTLGEPLRLRRPVDPTLFENALKLMEIWKSWFPQLSVIRIEADGEETRARSAPGRTAAFFSGGVDSFFTALEHRDSSNAPPRFPIDDLLNVWGFDIPLNKREPYTRMRDMLQKAAGELGKEFVPLATNLRDTRLESTGWGPRYFGVALASVALALEQRYSTALIASSSGYFDLAPRGSHPLTDPLLSTSGTRIVHDGAGFDKPDKISVVVQSEVAMRYLHVCWRLGSEENCGNCHKCYRTMTALSVLGALDRCETLKDLDFSVERVGKIYSYDDQDRAGMKRLRQFAAARGRHDIAEALERSLKHTDRVDRWTRIAKRWRTKPLIRHLRGRGFLSLFVRDSVLGLLLNASVDWEAAMSLVSNPGG